MMRIEKATMRSAEEVAREMVKRIDWERCNRLVKLDDGNGYVHIELASDAEIGDLEALLARLIKRAREEGAAEAPPADADERWRPGAVWEHRGRQVELVRTSYFQGLAWAHFPGMAMAQEQGEMTEASGWRYVGRGNGPQAIRIERTECPETGELLYRRSAPMQTPPADEQSAIDRAHADGIVEGLRRAEMACELRDADVIRRRISDEIYWASKGTTADRPPHVDRAALLELATGRESDAKRLSRGGRNTPAGLMNHGEARGLGRAADGAAAALAAQQPDETPEEQEARHRAELRRAREESHDRATYDEPPSPRDLAGRIRALVQEYAGRWLESTYVNERQTEFEMRTMRCAYHRVIRGESIDSAWIAVLRRDCQFRVADDLERIVRDCEVRG